MLAGFAIGLAAGLVINLTAGGAPWITTVTTYATGPIGQVFLRLLFMLVLPLLFAALVTGVAEMGDIAALRRVGLRTLLLLDVVLGYGADPDPAGGIMAPPRAVWAEEVRREPRGAP